MAFTLPDWISAKPETYLRARESGAEAGLGAQRLRQSAQDSAVQHALESQRLASQQDIASQRAAQALAEMQLRQELEQQKAQSAAEKLAANTEYQDRTLALREDSLAAKRSADEFRQAQLDAGLKLREEGITIRQEMLKLQQEAAKNRLDETTAKKQAELDNDLAQAEVLKDVHAARAENKTPEEILGVAESHPKYSLLTDAQQSLMVRIAMAQEREKPEIREARQLENSLTRLEAQGRNTAKQSEIRAALAMHNKATADLNNPRIQDMDAATRQRLQKSAKYAHDEVVRLNKELDEMWNRTAEPPSSLRSPEGPIGPPAPSGTNAPKRLRWTPNGLVPIQ